MNWIDFFGHMFKLSGVTLKENMRIMTQSTNVTFGVINLLRKTDPRIIQNFILIRLFTYMAPDSEKTMREAFNTYYEEQHYDVFPRCL